jgi:hypothetical protein
LPRKTEIEAAIAAYNATDPDLLLSPEVAQLLTIMFPRGDVCQRSLADLMAVSGDSMKRVARAAPPGGRRVPVQGGEPGSGPKCLPPAPAAGAPMKAELLLLLAMAVLALIGLAIYAIPFLPTGGG